MGCPSCGYENREEAAFCGRCGARLQIECESCGKVVRSGARFCKHCGTPVTMAAAAPPRGAPASRGPATDGDPPSRQPRAGRPRVSSPPAAAEILAICSQTKRSFVIPMTARRGRGWDVGRAYVPAPGAPGPTTGLRELKGPFEAGPDWKGCPVCGETRIGECSQCGQVFCARRAACWWSGGILVRCPNCGSMGIRAGAARAARGRGTQ